MDLSASDRRLLEALQRGVPLVIRPFDVLAGQLALPPARVVARVAELSGPEGVLREIAGIFDAPALGYQTALAALAVSDEAIPAAGGAVAAHPGVSHCYQRPGPLNLWFTLAVGPESRLGLEGTVAVLAQRAGARRVVQAPALRRYKLHVTFGWDSPPAGGDEATAPDTPAAPGPPNPAHIRAVRALQRPLGALETPFAPLAAAEGLTADELLTLGADLLRRRWMRRYAAVLRHRAAGIAANVLVAWRVPPEQADAFGQAAAGDSAVSHCYLRRTAPDWPYNLYTMLHGRSGADVAAALERLGRAGLFDRVELPTLREFKKAKVRLFSDDLAAWEAAAGPPA